MLIKKIINRLKNIWLELVTGFLWWGVGCVPSHIVRLFFYRLFGMRVGRGSTLHMRGRIYDPRFISIGEDTVIGEKFTLDGRRLLPGSTGSITIGSHVDIASDVMIWTSEHDIHSPLFKAREERVVVGDYVFIGPRAVILPGVEIGRGAVVAAGAVVTKSIPAMSIVGGVPAKEIGQRTSTLDYKLGRTRLFQ
jgi:acetyltransferase-like isoleucine patch superfamily enzyme